MLYRLSKEDNTIELMPYADFESLAKKEKDLENLSDLYIEDGQLMRIFQERARQEEPDLCALDKDGNLVLFELKRGEVQGDTIIQVMRYAQSWGHKSYYDLNEAYAKYCDKYKLPKQELKEAHKDAFGLDSALDYVQFNREQKMIGSQLNGDLSKNLK